MTDAKHEEIRRLSSTLIEKNPKVFQPPLFSSNSVKEHVKKSKIKGTWEETVDIFSCESPLKRPICTFWTSQKKWLTFKPIMITDSCSSIYHTITIIPFHVQSWCRTWRGSITLY